MYAEREFKIPARGGKVRDTIKIEISVFSSKNESGV